MVNFIKKKWKQILNIGRKDELHYLEIQKNALLNGVSVISLVTGLVITIVYSTLGYSNRYVPLISIPVFSLVLLFNKKHKYRIARNVAFFGMLISITFWSFYTRRSGAELLYISLACSSASIFRRKRTIFSAMITCSVLYFTYTIIDYSIPFTANPTINYIFIKTILAYITAGLIFFQIILNVDITNRISKSLDRKYDELVEFNKNLDHLVKQSNEELYSYQATINHNMYSIVTDFDGTIFKINEIYLEKMGYSKEEVLGENINIVKSLDHDEKFYEIIDKTIASGKVWRGESKIKTKKEGFFWVDSTILPVRDSKGIITKFLTISVDITDRKIAEEKEKTAVENFTKSQNHLSLLLENQTDLVVMADKLGNRNYVNNAFCEFFGKSQDFFIGTNYRTLEPKKVLKKYLKLFDSLSFENPKIKTIELLENDKKEKKWIQWNEFALFDENKNITEIFSIGHDITELKEIEFQNANYIAQFEEMAFKNSHKFRGPLSNILGIIDLYYSNDISDDEIEEFANLLKISADNLDVAAQEMSSFINLYHNEKKQINDKTNINLDFSEAKSKHLNWKYKIGNFIDGIGSLTKIQATSPLQSDLGKWFYGIGKPKYGHLESMKQLEIENEKIHNQVLELLDLKKDGFIKKSKLKYLEIIKTSDKIILLLDETEATVKTSITNNK